VTDDAIGTAEAWIDAEDEWREMVAELFALGRRLSAAEQEDLTLAERRVALARERHIAVLRDWSKTY
jgi:hypothetical protein